MKNIYVHPNASGKYFSFNPYITNLNASIGPYCNVINKDSVSNAGILNILKFLPKLNYIWFNWIEELPDKKGGFLQTMILLFIILYCKIASIKLIWTLHNKFSHYNRNKSIKKFLFWVLMKSSDYILTHSSEGVEVASTYGQKVRAKTKFIHHPIERSYSLNSAVKSTDILIWGSIIPYKGIDKFLEYLKDKNLDHKWNIKIIGKIPDPLYEQKLSSFINEKVKIENKFVDNEVLFQEVEEARCVLFTYTKNSVLSSGAAMDSIAMGANVVGPKCGAFLDLSNEGIIETYSDFDELAKLLSSSNVLQKKTDIQKIIAFNEKNSWKNFGHNVSVWLNFKNSK